MKSNQFYENFMSALTTKFPRRAELSNKLLDILPISKEALYRRLRGDVPFTFQEIGVIADKVGISLDNVVGLVSPKSRPFYLKLTNYAKPLEIDYFMAEEYINLLKEIKDEPDTEFAMAARMLPDALHLHFDHLSRFYLFKWLSQYDSTKKIQHYKEVSATDRILELMHDMADQYKYFKNAFYIFDRMFIQNYVNDIKYYEETRLIEKDDIKLLKEDIFNFMDYIENIAFRGVNEEGNKVSIFISNVNFDAGFSYIDSPKYKLSLVRSFTLYDLASMDAFTQDHVKIWMHSLLRTSTQISESGEIQRIKFFNEQRRIVESM